MFKTNIEKKSLPDKCKPRETGVRIKGNRSTKIIGWFSKRWTVSPRDLGSYPSFHRKIGKLIEKGTTIAGVHSSFFNHSLWKTSFGVIEFWSRCGVRAKGRQAPKTTAASSTPAVLRASIPAWNLWKHGLPGSQVKVSSCGFEWGYHWEIMWASWDMQLTGFGCPKSGSNLSSNLQ